MIGASAGGVETLKRVVSGLPRELSAAVCIVLHVAPDSPSMLARILARAGPLPARPAADGDELRQGEILVAPPDRHLVIDDDHVHLSIGPRENGHRPSVDVLFRSAADAKRGRVLGVILSGARGDGAAGLATIKARGGATIVQDPAEALYAGMPTTALAHVVVDAVVSSDLVADTIVAMVNGEEPSPAVRDLRPEGNPPTDDPGISICPECGGVLSERTEAGMVVWQCRVGHRYSPESLADEQAQSVEAAMWTAIRALEDRSRLLGRIADDFETRGQDRSSQSFRRRASTARDEMNLVRKALDQSHQLTLRKLAAGEAGLTVGNGADE